MGVFHMTTNLDGSPNGSDVSITALTMLNIAALMPTPDARVIRHTAKKSGRLKSIRAAKRQSCHIPLIMRGW
jgi:hypothetical protein